MDKTKILTLAKELGMSPEELLKKIERKKELQGGSSEEAAQKIQEEFHAKKEKDVEEKRVKPTVIRRRKVKVKEEKKEEKTEEKKEEIVITEKKDKEKEIKINEIKIKELEKAKEKLAKKIDEQAKKKKVVKKTTTKKGEKELSEDRKPEKRYKKPIEKEAIKIEQGIEEPIKQEDTTKLKKEKTLKKDDEEFKAKRRKKIKKLKTVFDKKKKIKDIDIKDDIEEEKEIKQQQEVLESEIQDAKQEEVTKKKIATKPIVKESKRKIKIEDDAILVGELAKKLNVKAAELIKKLVENGVMVTINNAIDIDTAALIAHEFGFEIEKVSDVEEKILSKIEVPDTEENLKPRPPIVTIMGHVDHGKTSLLDKIRNTNVTDSEAGGITQHIGAYSVEINGNQITFIDTPGHEAFTAMRARGAQITDIVILIVAADDGVMPQTREAIQHAQAAEVPIIVAINKIDKPEANPEKVINQLMEFNLVPEELGGDTFFVKVSAKTGEGIEDLLEVILLQAEMLELKANPKKMAKGFIIESKLEKGRGSVATVLIKEGTLKIGDSLVAGEYYCRVRAMNDYKGKRIKEAGPSTPVEILGFNGVPEPGEKVIALPNEKQAKELVEYRAEKKKVKELAQKQKITLEDLQQKIKEGQLKSLNIIVKTDVQGTVDAIKNSLEKLKNDEVTVKIIASGVGGITESDVLLAQTSNAIIVGFNVRPDSNARKLAEKEHIEIKTYTVIYDLIDDIKKALEGMLEPEIEEVYHGRAEIRQLFNVPKVGVVAGCYVIDGKITRNSKIRLLRDNVIIYEGSLASLKRFKDDVKEVQAGYECGMGIENFNDLKAGDIIEAYSIEEKKRALEINAG